MNRTDVEDDISVLDWAASSALVHTRRVREVKRQKGRVDGTYFSQSFWPSICLIPSFTDIAGDFIADVQSGSSSFPIRLITSSHDCSPSSVRSWPFPFHRPRAAIQSEKATSRPTRSRQHDTGNQLDNIESTASRYCLMYRKLHHSKAGAIRLQHYPQFHAPLAARSLRTAHL